MVEWAAHNRCVVGSSPAGRTIIFYNKIYSFIEYINGVIVISIIDVIRNKDLREYIPELSRFSDGTYRCACPIHKGDNPTSFAVFPNNRFYCFACNESGDIIKFVMEQENLTFYEAVDKLADAFGIDTRSDETYKKQIGLSEQNERFIASCVTEVDKVRDYLTKKRGFTDEVISEYKIGYNDKLKAVVIPMFNLYNQPVAFLYRFFDKTPKYKNSKNNELFTKGEFLYNMPNAEKILRKTKRLYLVEGAFDCMSAYQQGEAAVAYCGITFTKNHVRLIREMTERIDGIQIILVPDNDGKAINKVSRARDLFRTHYSSAEIRVATLDGESKDFNDMLVNGEVISDIETQNIDIFCMYQILRSQSSVESQYKAMEAYIKTVGNDLIKSDIAKLLAEEWGKDASEVREFLKVAEKANTSEIVLEFKDPIQCLNEMEERVLKQTGITTGIPTFDKSIGGLNLSDVFFIGARPACGKCLYEDSDVSTSTGIKKIKDLQVGEKLITYNERSKRLEYGLVNGLIKTGKKRGYKVTTLTGNSVIVSEDHPFLTVTGWKKVKDGLSVGEQIALPRFYDNESNETMPVEVVDFLALMIADGSISHGYVGYSKLDNNMVSIAKNCAKFFNTELVLQSGNEDTNYYFANPESSGIKSVLREHGLLGKCSHEKEISNKVFKLSKDLKKRFLSVLFSGDGSIEENRFVYYTTSKRLAEQLRVLLLEFGIRTTFTVKKSFYIRDGVRQECKPCYRVSVRAIDNDKFARSFECCREEQSFNQLQQSGLVNNVKLTRNQVDDIFDLFKNNRKELDSLLGYNKAGKNTRVTARHIWTKGLSHEKCRMFASDYNVQSLSYVNTEDLFFEKIVSIEDVGMVEMYDIEVSNGHNFIANNILVHNTMLALEMALHMAIKQKLNVLFFSLEMPAGALYMRIVAKILQISTVELKRKIMNREIDYSLIVDKISKYLKIVDTPSLTMGQIEERIKIANTIGLFDGAVNVVYIDYIQLISGMSEFADFEKNITGLNPIARRNNVLVVPLTQMNREIKSWQEPDVSQCKGGGSIEQVGNVILLLWREGDDPSLSEIDRQQMIESGKMNVVRAKIAKSREGHGEKYFSLVMNKDKSSMRECCA